MDNINDRQPTNTFIAINELRTANRKWVQLNILSRHIERPKGYLYAL